MTSVAPISAQTTLQPVPATPKARLAEAAQKFEAIFVRQMLAAASKTSFDSDGLFHSEAMGTFRQMQDERFADIAAERGSFGLAKMLEARLAKFVSDEGEA